MTRKEVIKEYKTVILNKLIKGEYTLIKNKEVKIDLSKISITVELNTFDGLVTVVKRENVQNCMNFTIWPFEKLYKAVSKISTEFRKSILESTEEFLTSGESPPEPDESFLDISREYCISIKPKRFNSKWCRYEYVIKCRSINNVYEWTYRLLPWSKPRRLMRKLKKCHQRKLKELRKNNHDDFHQALFEEF